MEEKNKSDYKFPEDIKEVRKLPIGEQMHLQWEVMAALHRMIMALDTRVHVFERLREEKDG